MNQRRSTVLAVLVAGLAISSGGATAAEDEITLPAQFLANIMVLDSLPAGTVAVDGGGGGGCVAVGPNGVAVICGQTATGGTHPTTSGTRPKSDAALLTFTIDRWTEGDESAKLSRTLGSGGILALLPEMEKMTVGRLQINSDLSWPVRLASTWPGPTGQVVRLALSGPVLFSRSPAPHGTDYTISIVDFTLPPSGGGEGTLVAATRVQFDRQGRIEVVDRPIASGVQKLTNVALAKHAADGARH